MMSLSNPDKQTSDNLYTKTGSEASGFSIFNKKASYILRYINSI